MKKYLVSPVIIWVILFFQNPCYSQIKKDTLFGFVGTWKNKTTFIIDFNLFTGVKGGTIIITPKKQITISTHGTDSYNKKIDEEIKDLDKAIDKTPNEILKEEGVSQAILAKKIKEQLVNLKDDFNSLKIGNVEMGAGQNSAQTSPNSCLAMETKYNELVAFYEAHKNDKKYSYNLPPPPEADYFDCWFCDKQKQIDFDKQVENYVKQFAKTERDYVADAFRIMKELGIDLYSGNSNPNKPICSINSNKLTSIFYWLQGRIGEMAKQLLRDNKKNYKRTMPVAKVTLFVGKLVQQMSEPNPEPMYEAAALYGKLADTLMKQIKREKDYTLLSAVPFMVSLDRDSKLLLGSDDMSFFEKIQDLGHFNLTIEMDAKMGKDGGYIIAHLKGISKMTYELDSTDCLHIVPAWKENSNQGNWNSISMNVIALEMLLPKGTPPKYIGTKIYRSAFPKIKLNFCKQGADSVYFQTFNPDPGSDGTWLFVVPKAPTQRVPAGLMGVDRMFCDINDLEQEASKITAPPAMNEAALKEIQKISADIQKNGVTPEKMKKIQELTQKSVQQAQEVALPISNFKFVVNFQNKNSVLLNHSFDAKQINPQLNNEIVYGYFKIKLEEASQKKSNQ